MSKTIKHISIVTALILGVFLSGSAFAAVVSIDASGTFTTDDNNIEITLTTISLGSNLLSINDTITLTLEDSGSSSEKNISGIDIDGSNLDLIGQAGANDIWETYSDDDLVLLVGSFTITGGGQSGDYQSIGSLQITFNGDVAGVDIYLNSVPIPSSLILAGFGLMLLAGHRQRRIKA